MSLVSRRGMWGFVSIASLAMAAACLGWNRPHPTAGAAVSDASDNPGGATRARVVGSQGSEASFGPYLCPGRSCALSIPMPDDGTNAFIAALNDGTASSAAGVSSQGLELTPGDKVMVCNDSHCATYEMSDDSRFRGADLKERISSRELGAK